MFNYVLTCVYTVYSFLTTHTYIYIHMYIYIYTYIHIYIYSDTDVGVIKGSAKSHIAPLPVVSSFPSWPGECYGWRCCNCKTNWVTWSWLFLSVHEKSFLRLDDGKWLENGRPISSPNWPLAIRGPDDQPYVFFFLLTLFSDKVK